jgi:hypothetical protein
MFGFTENIKMPNGRLEIIVSNHYTGEIISHDPGHNQLQDWAKHALTFLSSGRPFCTLGNHGEQVTDTGGTTFAINHYEDGSNTNKIVASPWVYGTGVAGLVQKRNVATGDEIEESGITAGQPIYPFFPTKMRFGTGGLDAGQNPKNDVSTTATSLVVYDNTCPFVVMDRARTTQHIVLSESSSITTNRVTYSVKLPGGDASYPYNGKVISEAGLFCDAGLITGNNLNMRTGMMLAYRTFKGIVKDESIDIVFNWSWKM